MANCKLSIDIAAPLEVVWLLTQDPGRRPEWDFRIKEARLLDMSTPRKGAKLRSRGRLIGPFEMEMEYVTVEQNRRSAVKMIKSKGLPFKSGGGSWHYKPLGNGHCRFETNIQMFTRKTWFGKLLDTLLFEPFLKWMTWKSLKKLKAVAESDFRKQPYLENLLKGNGGTRHV